MIKLQIAQLLCEAVPEMPFHRGNGKMEEHTFFINSKCSTHGGSFSYTGVESSFSSTALFGFGQSSMAQENTQMKFCQNVTAETRPIDSTQRFLQSYDEA